MKKLSFILSAYLVMAFLAFQPAPAQVPAKEVTDRSQLWQGCSISTPPGLSILQQKRAHPTGAATVQSFKQK